MKKALMYTVIAAMMMFLPLTACDSSSAGNESYQTVANQEEDCAFTFESSLPDEEFIVPASSGRKIYVSSSYTGALSDGSEASPYTTLAEVNNLKLQPGDQILFKCGDTFSGYLNYTGLSGADDNPITFSSYGEGQRSILYSPSTDAIVFEKASNIVVRGLKVRVDGVERTHYSGECRTGIKFNYNYVGENHYRNIYIIDNEVEGNGSQMNLMGITIDSLESTHEQAPSNIVTNAYVIGNTVHNLGRSGIKCSGWLANEKTNQNNSSFTLYQNVHFDSNHVYDIGCIGIYIVGCTSSTMNRNLVHDIGIYEQVGSIQTMEGECGMMALGTDTCDILFNEVYNCFDQGTGYDAMGIDIDWNTTNVNVQYNYLHDCQGPGVGTMANQNSFIRNNYIRDCRGDTNQAGSIVVSNFTSRYACVGEDMHAVKNLLIQDNLVHHSADNKSIFTVWPSNGDEDYEGNQFVENHLVYTGENVSDIYFINVDPSLPWYKFANNKYYSQDPSVFKVLEATPAVYINIEEGAQPYTVSRTDAFGAWQKRDLGATYQTIDSSVPANPSDARVSYENGELTLSWKAGKGNVWHYNLFDVGFDEDVDYRKMLGETETTSFTYTPSRNGDHYIIVQPESDTGVLGKALKIKVTL